MGGVMGGGQGGQGMPSQWGDLSQNNGWGSFNTGPNNSSNNPYPSLENEPNPLQMLGAAFSGGQGNNMGGNTGGNTGGGLNNAKNQY